MAILPRLIFRHDEGARQFCGSPRVLHRLRDHLCRCQAERHDADEGRGKSQVTEGHHCGKVA